MDLRSARYRETAPRARLGESLIESVRALPGVESALLWGPSMLGSGTWILYAVTEEGPQKPEDARMIARHSVNPGGLRDLGIPIVAGRDFTSEDRDGAPRAAILSESAAQMLWPGKDPLGRRFRPQSAAPEDPWITVVGVAADARHRTRFHPRVGALAFEPQLDCYFPYAQAPVRSTVLAVRAKADPEALAGAVRRAVLALDPDLPVYDVKTLDARLAEEEGQPRRLAALLSAYAGVAATLAALGLYGVLAVAVARRTREIGIRMALGATARRVLTEVAGEGLRLATAGVLLGLVGGWGLGRLLASQLFAVSPADPIALAAAGAVLLLAAAAATFVPARRAARLDPMNALRTDG
jgi:predicted permease